MMVLVLVLIKMVMVLGAARTRPPECNPPPPRREQAAWRLGGIAVSHP